MRKFKKFLLFDVSVQVVVLLIAVCWIIMLTQPSNRMNMNLISGPIWYYTIIGPWNFFGNILYLYFQRNMPEAISWRKKFFGFALTFISLSFAVIGIQFFYIKANDWIWLYMLFMFIAGGLFPIAYLIGSAITLSKSK